MGQLLRYQLTHRGTSDITSVNNSKSVKQGRVLSVHVCPTFKDMVGYPKILQNIHETGEDSVHECPTKDMVGYPKVSTGIPYTQVLYQ